MFTFVGTSGYYYNHWCTGLIPGKTGFYRTKKSSLEEYSEHFNFVELNSPFYKIPSTETVKGWRDRSPDHFKFVIKVNKRLTHTKKLIEFETLFSEFYNILSLLGDKLIGFLIQLPPSFGNTSNKSRVDGLTPIQRLAKVCNFTKAHYPNVDFFVEFRHHTWFCPEVFEVLRHKWSLVVVHLNNHGKQYGKHMSSGFSPPLSMFPDALTVPHKIYFRNHGSWWHIPYTGGYSDEQLALMISLFQSEKTIVAFDNTDSLQYQLCVPALPNKQVFTTDFFTATSILPQAVVDAKRLLEIV